MNNILFKCLALAVIGGTVPPTAISAYQTNLNNISTVQNEKPVGWPNTNPVFVPAQQDSQGADTVTLSDVSPEGFVLNYTLSAATLAYFYPSIGQYVNPNDAVYQLLTTGSCWTPTTHYWQPLQKENAFSTFIDTALYNNYLNKFKESLVTTYSYTSNLIPSLNMAILNQAVATGSGYQITAQVQTDGDNVNYVTIVSNAVKSHYPPSAKTEGADAVFGNMNEPNNVLKVNISANTAKYAYDNYHNDINAFLGWLFHSGNTGFVASDTLNSYVNNNDTQGFKYNQDTRQMESYWGTNNYDLVKDAIIQQFTNIMDAANNPANKNGITLTMIRDTSGNVNMTVTPQLQAFRPVYNQERKFTSTGNTDYVYLNVHDLMAFRYASFAYLTDKSQFTERAWVNAYKWLFGQNGDWDNPVVVHPFADGSKVNNQGAWIDAMKVWNWASVDQLTANLLVQNRGVVFRLNNALYKVKPTIDVYGQDLAS